MTTALCIAGIVCLGFGFTTFRLTLDAESVVVRNISGATTAALLVTLLAIYTAI